MDIAILRPVVALIAWSMVMWLWLYITRIPAMRVARIDARTLRGGTGRDLSTVLPPQVNWVADNYNHLMEQPTLFYAVAITLAIVGNGAGEGPGLWLAWAYVVLRVLHSIVQATVNRVLWRFTIFAAASLCLAALALRALLALF